MRTSTRWKEAAKCFVCGRCAFCVVIHVIPFQAQSPASVTTTSTHRGWYLGDVINTSWGLGAEIPWFYDTFKGLHLLQTCRVNVHLFCSLVISQRYTLIEPCFQHWLSFQLCCVWAPAMPSHAAEARVLSCRFLLSYNKYTTCCNANSPLVLYLWWKITPMYKW